MLQKFLSKNPQQKRSRGQFLTKDNWQKGVKHFLKAVVLFGTTIA